MIIGIDASLANRQRKTGTEWYSFYLIKNLAIIDKVNTYWLYLNAPASPEIIDIVKNNSNFIFKHLDWPFNSFWTLGRLSIEMILKRPDVLFVPAHTLPLFSPRRTINTIHDVAFFREKNLYFSQKLKSSRFGLRTLINFLVKLITLGRYRADSVDYLFWSTNFAIKSAWKIITVSNFTKQEILQLCPSAKEKKIKVIHNGYNDQLYRKIIDEEKINSVLRKYNLTQPYFLYVGRLEKKKNTPTLIEALALLRDLHPEIKEKLVLIGNASFGFDEVKYIIEEFNLNNEVIIPGWVDEEDMPYIYNAASAFVFPTKHEGFGIPILESMACGLPTIASDLPVLREVAGDAIVYFDQNDKNNIAYTMFRIISDQNLRQELITRGLEKSREFSWHKCAQETLRELEEKI